MLIRRKEAKAYGTKKLIEGHFKLNQRCVIIEDVVTSGSSILETEADLRKEGLLVDRAVIILDREQGGLENLRKRGIQVEALIAMSSLVNILLKAGLITAAVSEQVKEYLKSSQTTLGMLLFSFYISCLKCVKLSVLNKNSFYDSITYNCYQFLSNVLTADFLT